MKLYLKLQGMAMKREGLKGRWLHIVESLENSAKECGFYSIVSGGGHLGRKLSEV